MSNAREMRDMLNDILEECPVIGKFYGLEMETERITDHLIANGVTINRGTEDTPVAYNLSPTAARFLLKENGEIIPLTTCQQWIPVSERLPEVVDSYIVVVKCKYDWEKEYEIGVDIATYDPYCDHPYIDGCWNTYNDWNEGQQYLHVTHWMPLPEPPKGE